MKKILFAIALILTIGLTANAQGRRDGLFSDWDNNREIIDASDPMPLVLGGSVGGLEGNQGAPLGSGLLVLTALGAGYAIARKHKKE